MDVFDRETAIILARHATWPAVSIFMPAHRGHTETQQDQIRLKNLLAKAENELLGGGMRVPEATALLQPARDVLADGAFWKSTSEGLAIFLAGDIAHVFSTDTSLTEQVCVSDRFLMRPMVPVLADGERYFVLALSKKQVRLLEGARDELTEVGLSGAPASLADALKYDDYENQVQFHSLATAAGGQHPGGRSMFHGHGGTADIEKTNIERYLRMVDKGVHELLHDDDAPLLLAGVDYLLPIYRSINSYPHLVATALPGNPDELPIAHLRQQALAALAPHFRKELEADMRTLEEMDGTTSVTRDLTAILPASHEGRIRVLFVAEDTPVWGLFDPSGGAVDIHPQRLPSDRDLTDVAVAETLLHGGDVHTLAVGPTLPAAILRY
ncbi:MAG: hypothetical protein Q8K99_13925 [Actinomycetota bacterium]|nr:hypothetical protein [Actinomycetota bacterium]